MSDNDALDRALRVHAAEWDDELGTPHAPGINQLLAGRRTTRPARRRWTAVGLSAVAAGVVIATVTIPHTSTDGAVPPGQGGVAADTSSSPSGATPVSPSGLPAPLIATATAGTDSATPASSTSAPDPVVAALQDRLTNVLNAGQAELSKDPALTQQSIDLDDSAVVILSHGPLAAATKKSLLDAAKAYPDVDVVFDESAKFTQHQVDAAIETLSNDEGIMQSLQVKTISPAGDGSGIDVQIASGDAADAKQRLETQLDVDVHVTVGGDLSTM
ncbi:MAG: hypothetical protein JWM93_2180 [Frankiales bacterium]|nr:hypothetical protein [Frankiales bacterium]